MEGCGGGRDKLKIFLRSFGFCRGKQGRDGVLEGKRCGKALMVEWERFERCQGVGCEPWKQVEGEGGMKPPGFRFKVGGEGDEQ